MGEECSDEQKGVFLVQEMLRSHTQFVRNWGFFDRVIALLNVLYSPLDDEILQHVGLSASQLIAAFVHLIRQLESRFFEVFHRMGEVLRQGTLEEMIRKYYEVHPDLLDTPDDMLAFAAEERLTAQQVKVLLLAHMEFRLPKVCKFTVESVAAFLGVEAPESAHRLAN